MAFVCRFLLLAVISIFSSATSATVHKIVEVPLYRGPKISFDQYSGYIQANKEHGRQLFYWFVTSQKDPDKDPVVLWLSGGPGCSSMFALVSENGPFRLSEDGSFLSPNPHSWNRIANVIYIDQPAGTGFSYSKDKTDYETCNDTRTAEDLYEFLQGFFTAFPQFKSNPFFVAAESYGGHYGPIISNRIWLGNLDPSNIKINLEGYLVGNGVTDDILDTNSIPMFMMEHSLISSAQYYAAYEACSGDFYANLHHEECDDAWQSMQDNVQNLDLYNIYSSCQGGGLRCDQLGEKQRNKERGKRSSFWLRSAILSSSPSFSCPSNNTALMDYFNSKAVWNALAVDSPGVWLSCNALITQTYTSKYVSLIDLHETLLNYGFRGMMYSGDIDLVVNALGTQSAIDQMLSPSECENFRQWALGNLVGGWWKEGFGGKFRYVTIRGAGHMVPMDAPEAAFVIFQRDFFLMKLRVVAVGPRRVRYGSVLALRETGRLQFERRSPDYHEQDFLHQLQDENIKLPIRLSPENFVTTQSTVTCRLRNAKRRRKRPIGNVLSTYSFARAYVAISKRENAPIVREIRRFAKDLRVRIDLKFLSRSQYVSLMQTLKRKKPQLKELSVTVGRTQDASGYVDNADLEFPRVVLEAQKMSKSPSIRFRLELPKFLRWISPCITDTLTVLRLDGIDFGSVRESAMMILPKALSQTHDSLRVFSVRHCHIGDDQFLMISNELKRCRRIEVLDLSGNYFSDRSVAVVITLLKVKQEQQSEFDWLTSLRNYENEEEQQQLEELFDRSQGLVSVNLSDNFISSVTISKMVEILRSDTTLKSLNLANNLIDNEGVLSLDELLAQKNSTIEMIDLSQNPAVHETEVRRLRATLWETHARPDGLLFLRQRQQQQQRGTTPADTGATTLHNCSMTLLSLLRQGHDFSVVRAPIDQKFATIVKYIAQKQLGLLTTAAAESESAEFEKRDSGTTRLQEEQVAHLLATMLERVTQLEESAIAHISAQQEEDDDEEQQQQLLRSDGDDDSYSLDSSIMDDGRMTRMNGGKKSSSSSYLKKDNDLDDDGEEEEEEEEESEEDVEERHRRRRVGRRDRRGGHRGGLGDFGDEKKTFREQVADRVRDLFGS